MEEKKEEKAPVANWRRGKFDANEDPSQGTRPESKGGLGNLGHVTVHEGGGKKRGKKGKKQGVVVSAGEQQQQKQVPQTMPAAEGDFPSLNDY